MNATRITVTGTPRPEELDQLRAGLTEHASAFVEGPGFEPIAVLVL